MHRAGRCARRFAPAQCTRCTGQGLPRPSLHPVGAGQGAGWAAWPRRAWAGSAFPCPHFSLLSPCLEQLSPHWAMHGAVSDPPHTHTLLPPPPSSILDPARRGGHFVLHPLGSFSPRLLQPIPADGVGAEGTAAYLRWPAARAAASTAGRARVSLGHALTIPCTRRVCTPRRTPPARTSAPCCCQTSVSICPCPVLAAPQPAVIPADDNPAVPEQDGQELPLQRDSAASFVGACHHLLHTKGPRC